MGIKRKLFDFIWNSILTLKKDIRLPIDELSISFISAVYNIERIRKKELVDRILSYDASNVNFAEEERAFPGNSDFLKSGYSEVMLKRYFFAGKYFCDNKKVLDSCSGLGWGSFILSRYAKELKAFDLSSEAINYSQKEWGKEIDWQVGNALDMSFLKGEKFEVAIAMETIEHFSKKDGELYIEQLSNSLCLGGILIGTSAFPKDRHAADKLCRTNPYHLYVFTFAEINELLSKFFSEYKIIEKWMFVARK